MTLNTQVDPEPYMPAHHSTLMVQRPFQAGLRFSMKAVRPSR